MNSLFSALTAFCCAPTNKNRKEEQNMMHQSMQRNSLNTPRMRVNKDGFQEVDIKDLTPDQL